MKIKPYLAISGILSAILLTGCASFLKAAHKAGEKAAPKTVYEPLVTVLKPIKGVPIIASYRGGVFYQVQATNTLPSPIRLVWDESSYITTAKKTVRLLHLPNRNELPQDPPAQQASTTIAPGAQFQTEFTGKDWLDCARRNCTPQPKNGQANALINLVFKIKGKRVKWQGEVAFVAAGQP